jgi:hypothetical protein
MRRGGRAAVLACQRGDVDDAVPSPRMKRQAEYPAIVERIVHAHRHQVTLRQRLPDPATGAQAGKLLRCAEN